MAIVSVAFIGDIVGGPGRKVLQQQLPRLREAYAPDLIVVNAENARQGSGLTPKQYEQILALGVDGVTLGDHWHRDQSIATVLQHPESRIARPANISRRAPGRGMLRLPPAGDRTKSLYVIPVLGRIFLSLPADDPFATVDRLLETLEERDPIVLIEAHMEATSEKIALAHHLVGRVTAVVGTHTHVPTADARILPGGTAFITDLGMTGPYHSVIGRDVRSVVEHMTTGMHRRFDVGEGDERLCGAVVRYNESTTRSLSITPFQFHADPAEPPFAGP